MDIRDHLRQLNAFRPRTSRAAIDAPPRLEKAFDRLEDLVPGAVVENEAGQCYVVRKEYPLDASHGQMTIGTLLAQKPTAIAPYSPTAHMDGLAEFTHSAFLDTETTGLGPGASIYAFMVGIGSFEATANAAGEPSLHYVVDQYFMRSPGEEAALLVAVARHLESRDLLVTFNGRSFDLPLLRTRYASNRRGLPTHARAPALFQDGAPHLDLLHPARQLWKRRLQSCRLSNLEDKLLGFARTVEDVPGADIPQMYIDFVRTGSAEMVQRVFYHNREDIVSTMVLTAHICKVLDDAQGLDAGAPGEDWLATGAAHERAGRVALAERAYRRSLDSAPDPIRGEIFMRLGRLQKRSGRWKDAIATWELWVSSVPGADVTPYIELAKCYEWNARDLAEAEMWAAWGLHILSGAPAWQQRPGQLSDLEQRLARIRARRQRMG